MENRLSSSKVPIGIARRALFSTVLAEAGFQHRCVRVRRTVATSLAFFAFPTILISCGPCASGYRDVPALDDCQTASTITIKAPSRFECAGPIRVDRLYAAAPYLDVMQTCGSDGEIYLRLDLPKYEGPATYALPSPNVYVLASFDNNFADGIPPLNFVLTSGTITMENYSNSNYGFSLDMEFETDAQEPIAIVGRHDVSGCKIGYQCIVDD